MTAIRLIRDADLIRRPWKNGGGTTAEIAACPPEADFDGFLWRLSMAEVGSDGPFSTFPGIDRTLVLIDGPGLALNIDGHIRHLNAAAPICCFSGDVPTTGQLTNGPVRDFNVMTRRGRAKHSVHFPAAGKVETIGETLILANEAPIEIEAGGTTHRLLRFDALHMTGRNSVRLSGPAVLASITVAASD